MISALVFVAVAVVLIVATYIVIHHYLPTWGTITTNVIASIGAVIGMAGDFVTQATGLPWNTILDQAHAAQVLFSLAIANIIIRLNGPKLPVGQPTPPAGGN